MAFKAARMIPQGMRYCFLRSERIEMPPSLQLVRNIVPSSAPAPRRIRAALHAVADGLTAIDDEIADAVLPHVRATVDLIEPLTARELEVLNHLAAGLTNKEIATRLGISDHTVKFHVNGILGKLG